MWKPAQNLSQTGHHPRTTGKKRGSGPGGGAPSLFSTQRASKPPSQGRRPLRQDKGSPSRRRARVRMRIAVSAAAQVVGGRRDPGREAQRGESREARMGRSLELSRAPTGGRRRTRPRRPYGPPLPSGGSCSRCSRLRCPPVSAARPLRSCARSQSPPPTSSDTSSSAAATAHLLPPTPQPLSPLLPSTVLALCRLSGKCEAPKLASPSSLLQPHAASPRLRDGFHEVGIGRGQRRRPLLAPSALRRLDWGDLERDPCKGCTRARARSCVCPEGGLSTRPASRGPVRCCAHRVGRGWR